MPSIKTKTTVGRKPRKGGIVGKYSAVARDSQGGSQSGRQASGLYPQVSRTKLAKALHRDITTISQILCGRIRPKVDAAIAIAKAIGIEIEQFEADWQRQRKVFERQHILNSDRRQAE